MDLVLHNLQRLIYHKTQTTNKQTKLFAMLICKMYVSARVFKIFFLCVFVSVCVCVCVYVCAIIKRINKAKKYLLRTVCNDF